VNASAFLVNGLTLGSGGRVIFGGSSPMLSAAGTQTIGGSGQMVFDSTTSPGIRATGTLTIGPGITVRSGASGGALTGGGAAAGAIVLEGTYSAGTPGKTLAVQFVSFTNAGVMEARDGGALSVFITPFAPLTNFSAGTLTGGTFAAYAGSNLSLSGVSVTANASNILLSGAGSTMNAINGLTSNVGSFTISAGRNFTTIGAFQNAGTVGVGAGSTFASTGAFTWSGGAIDGAGAFVASAANVTENVARTGGGVTRFDSITIASDKRLDLADGKLVTREAVGSATAGGAYDGVQGLVQSAYHFSAWDGAGIFTSMADAQADRAITTLAVATADEVFFAGGTFGGVSVASGDVLVMYTYAGDLNLDGLVDGADYGVIDNYVQFPGTDGYANGDFNYDGVIDGADYGVIDNTIQLQGEPFPGGTYAVFGGTGVTPVPEPSAGAVTLLAVLIGAGRRRRRCRRHRA
jgi:hypothetical protein